MAKENSIYVSGGKEFELDPAMADSDFKMYKVEIGGRKFYRLDATFFISDGDADSVKDFDEIKLEEGQDVYDLPNLLEVCDAYVDSKKTPKSLLVTGANLRMGGKPIGSGATDMLTFDIQISLGNGGKTNNGGM